MAVANGAAIGAITGAAGAAANGGNVFKGALKGAFSGAVFGGAGGGAGLEGLLTEAVVGGTMSVIQGGKFGAGFLSAGFSRVAGGFVKGDSLRRAISTVIIGGTAARLGGGKFKNGAISASFTFAVSTIAEHMTSVQSAQEGLSAGATVLSDIGNYGEGRAILGGKIIVSKHGSSSATVSDAELATVQGAFDNIATKGGSNGRQLMESLSVGRPLELILNSSGGNSAGRSNYRMTVDLSTHVNIKSSLYRFSPTRIIAHEATHAVLGYSDRPYSANKVVNFTDGIMKGINGSVRGDYYNVCRPGSC